MTGKTQRKKFRLSSKEEDPSSVTIKKGGSPDTTQGATEDHKRALRKIRMDNIGHSSCIYKRSCALVRGLKFILSIPLYPFSRSRCHVYGGSWCYQRYFSRLRKFRSETEKPKIIRGDRLDYQRILVDPILNVLANKGSDRVIPRYDNGRTFDDSHKKTQESVRLCCIYLRLVKTESDKSLPRQYRTSLYREPLDTLHSSVLSNLESVECCVCRLSHRAIESVDIAPNSSDLDHYAPGFNGEGNKLYIVVVMYQPWCLQYPEWDGAWSYENYPSKLTTVLPEFYDFVSNAHHFDNGGSTESRGRNEITVANNQRFEGYIDECGMYGSVGYSPNDCLILQEPPPPFIPQSVQESSLEDLMKQLAMNNIQFQKNVSATQQPVQQLNSSPSLEDLVQQFQQNTMQIQQNNMQFQQNIIATMQDLTTQIGQLATTINQLQFEDSGQVPSQAILNPQENE
ncbi:hypothetical protein CR513_43868, partial [Mucuna pruriens]